MSSTKNEVLARFGGGRKTKEAAKGYEYLKKLLNNFPARESPSLLKKILIATRLAKPLPFDPKSIGRPWAGNLSRRSDVLLPSLFTRDMVAGGPALEATIGGKALAFSGAAGATIGGLHSLGDVIDRKQTHKDAKVSWGKVMKENPDLSKYPERTLKNHFRTLVNFSPSMAKDPTVAGSWLRMTAERADLGIDSKQIKDIADIHKSYIGSRAEKGGGPASAIRNLTGALGGLM